MLKQTLIAVSLGLLALGAGRPAAAQVRFLNEYGLIAGARPAQTTKEDVLPRNAMQAQGGEEDSSHTFVVGGFFGRQDFLGGDITQWGGGVGLIGNTDPRHPWQITARFFNTNLDVAGFEDDAFGYAVGGKYVFNATGKRTEPVASFFGEYSDVSRYGEALQLGIAVDQRVSNSIYLTGNIAWTHVENGAAENDLTGGVGVTLASGRWPRLSFSADYQWENDIVGEDLWSVSALYAATDNLSLQIGGGKNDLIFGSINLKRQNRR